MTAPIAIFIYNRPAKLRRMLCSLVACDGFEDRPIYVFADGPKLEERSEAIAEARSVAREMLGDRAVYCDATLNKGLARSIIEGVEELTLNFGRVIVIEDDLELAPRFLTFMDNALDHYADDPTVMQVSGHVFDVPDFKDRNSALVLPLTTTWGWATWRRAWLNFDETAASARRVLDSPQSRKSFNLDGIYDYASMLEDQLSGRRDSWGIRFYLSVFAANGVSVFPPRSLVRNSGFDGSGSHGRGWFRAFGAPADSVWTPEFDQWSFPPAETSEQDFDAIKRAIWNQNGGMLGQIVDAAKRSLKNFR
jgi:hypothetical protein